MSCWMLNLGLLGGEFGKAGPAGLVWEDGSRRGSFFPRYFALFLGHTLTFSSFSPVKAKGPGEG